jgi:UDP-glucose 4-epimerase
MESSKPLANKTVVVTGGTGSLGKILTQRIMNGEMGLPNKVVIFSRDEAKQHAMRLHYKQREAATEEIIYRNAKDRIEFVIGDVRDYHSVVEVLRNADIVFNAAAMKQVPTCEYFPMEAVRTNVGGAESIVRAIREHSLPVETVVGISTDKAAKPVNVMGMTKALQERVLITANLTCKKTRFVCVRYGNVIASRGSVVPLFIEQINAGGPVTITTEKMTRFLLTLNQAVDTVFAAVRGALPGETYIPKVPAVRMKDLAKAMIGNKKIKIEVIGIRPGEKEHEILISEEERFRAVDRGNYYAIQPILPELRPVSVKTAALKGEYSSETELLDYKQVQALVKRERLFEGKGEEGELLR